MPRPPGSADSISTAYISQVDHGRPSKAHMTDGQSQRQIRPPDPIGTRATPVRVLHHPPPAEEVCNYGLVNGLWGVCKLRRKEENPRVRGCDIFRECKGPHHISPPDVRIRLPSRQAPCLEVTRDSRGLMTVLPACSRRNAGDRHERQSEQRGRPLSRDAAACARVHA